MTLFPTDSRWALPSGAIVRVIAFKPGEVRCHYMNDEQEPVSFDPEWLYKCGVRIGG